MHGTNLELITLRCRVCHRWIALRVDQDDLDRHYGGVYVQHAFVASRLARSRESTVT